MMRATITAGPPALVRQFNNPTDPAKKAFHDAYQSARQIIGGSGPNPADPTPEPPAA